MSFRVWKGESTPSPRPTMAPAVRPALSSDVVDAGAGRLAVLALLTAGVTVLLGLLDWHMFATSGALPPDASVWLAATVVSLGLSLSVAWIAWRRMVAPATLLDIGLVYEVAQALCISLIFHAVPLQGGVAPRGWNGVAVWILAYPLIVPATRGKTILATLAAAAMDPLGYLVTLAAGNPRQRTLQLLIVAFIALVLVLGGLILLVVMTMRHPDAGTSRNSGGRVEERLAWR